MSDSFPYLCGKIERATGENAKDVLMRFSGLPWKEAKRSVEAVVNETITESTLRKVFRLYKIHFKPMSFVRSNTKGEHQKVICQILNPHGLPEKSFIDTIDHILYADEGIIDPLGLKKTDQQCGFSIVKNLSSAIYPAKGDRRKRYFRQSLLRALGERSIMLGMDFHLRSRFPQSLLGLPKYDDIIPTEEEDVHKDYTLENAYCNSMGKEISGFFALADGSVIIFSDGSGVKQMPTRKGDGRIIINYESLSKQQVNAHITRQKSIVEAQLNSLESIPA